MRCPKCREADLQVSHTYPIDESLKVRRLECPNCGAVATAQTVTTVTIDPPHGQGAFSVAGRLRRRSRGGQSSFGQAMP